MVTLSQLQRTKKGTMLKYRLDSQTAGIDADVAFVGVDIEGDDTRMAVVKIVKIISQEEGSFKIEGDSVRARFSELTMTGEVASENSS